MKYPLELDYDADLDGDTYKTTHASILDADRCLIVEEAGPEGDWRDLEELVTRANSYDAHRAVAEAAKRYMAGHPCSDTKGTQCPTHIELREALAALEATR